MILTGEQEAALDASLVGNGNTVAWVGYPGSGKTTMMKELYGRLGSNAKEYRMLCFSKYNSNSMKATIGDYEGISTTHSLCWKLLARKWHRNAGNWQHQDGRRHRRFVTWAAREFYGVDDVKLFTQEQNAGIDDFLKVVDLVQSHSLPWRDIGKVLVTARRFVREPSDAAFLEGQLAKVMRWCAKGFNESEARAYHDGEEGCRYRIADGYEFSDLAWAVANFDGLQTYAYKNTGIAIDEVQDSTPTERMVWERCLGPDASLLLVGDPAQAIMFFRGAYPDMFGRLVKHFDADLCPMRVSFRLPKAVLSLARQWVPDLQIAPSAIQGCNEVVDMMDILESVGPGSAIICRTNVQAIRWALFLLRHGIPAIVKGTDISRDMLALVGQLAAIDGFRFDELPLHLQAWVQQQEVILRRVHTHNPEEYVKEARERASSLLCFYQGAVEKGCRTTHAFGRVILDTFKDDGDAHGKAVQCMTGHKAKGSEFPHVIVEEADIIGVRGSTPDEIAQHRALQYVMCTRTLDRFQQIREGASLRNEDRW